MNAIARRSKTARALAPMPIKSATTVSNHTLRSTVKSRNADGLDFIGNSFRQGFEHVRECASKPLPVAVPDRSIRAHDRLQVDPELARPCASLVKSLSAGQPCPRLAPAALRAPIG